MVFSAVNGRNSDTVYITSSLLNSVFLHFNFNIGTSARAPVTA